MAKPYIDEARDQHAVGSLNDYLRDHEHFRRRWARKTGRPWSQLAPRPPVGEPKVARVDMDRWIVDCECNNGCAIWWNEDGDGVACCYGCGQIHQVQEVPNRDEIEAALLERPVPYTRKYDPGETPEDLRRQNQTHGVS